MSCIFSKLGILRKQDLKVSVTYFEGRGISVTEIKQLTSEELLSKDFAISVSFPKPIHSIT